MILNCFPGQTPQRREFGFPRFLASTSPHERIIERFHEERGPYKTDDEDDDASEFSQLSRRHTAADASKTAAAATTVHRSVSMNDLANTEKSASHRSSMLIPPGASSFRSSTGESHANPSLLRTLSVEGSIDTSPNASKDNKENFAVPQDPTPAIAGSSGVKKPQRQQSGQQSGRKILNAQNTKSS